MIKKPQKGRIFGVRVDRKPERMPALRDSESPDKKPTIGTYINTYLYYLGTSLPYL